MTTRTVSELAAICGAQLHGDGTTVVVGPASLGDAGPGEISFLDGPRYRELLDRTRAAAVLVHPETTCAREDVALLRCADPRAAFDLVVNEFAVAAPLPSAGVHPSAIVDPSAELAEDVGIGPLCVVGAGVRLGSGARLVGRVWVGDGAAIGARTIVHPGVVLYGGVQVGDDCILHAGAVLGADGFGFDPTPRGWERIPQVGTVVVEDDVEVGANSTIDRARFGATRLRRGAKLDDLVHVAHNVEVGEAALLVAQVGIAGSAKIGARVMLAGQSGVSDHVHIGDDARVGAKSAVLKDVAAGCEVYGIPAGPKRATMRAHQRMLRLESLVSTVRELQERVRSLEEERA